MRRFLAILLVFAASFIYSPAFAQATKTVVVASCGTPPTGFGTYTAGQVLPLTMDTTGKLCDGGGGGGGGSVTITGPLGTGAAAAGVTVTLDSTDAAALQSIITNTGAATPAGANVIGHVINDASSAVIGHVIADTGSTTVVTGTVTASATLQTQTDTVMVGGVNVKEINAVTPLMGNGVTGTGSLRVTIASDNTANSNPFLVSLQPAASGGMSWYNVEPGASDNHVNIKNGAGQVYTITTFNNSATINYMRLYNAATGFNGCNSATNLVWEGHIPANTSDAGFVIDFGQGIAFATGISICVTGAYGQTNTTAATASAMSVGVGYK